MNTALGVLIVMVLIGVKKHADMEITAMRYCLLKAMATQSKEVDRVLHKLLKTKGDYKVLNKDFKSIEAVYLTNLNDYLISHSGSDGPSLRRELLEDHFEL